MIVLTIILGAVVIIFLTCEWFQRWSTFAKQLNSFPGRTALPIFGNSLDFSSKPELCFANLRALLKLYNETIRMWFGFYGSLHIITADDAEIILSSTKTIDKGTLYSNLHRWLGTGLLTSSGQKWQQRRKLLTSAFHFSILHKFVNIFGGLCNNFTKKLLEESGKSITNIIPLVTKLTLASICGNYTVHICIHRNQSSYHLCVEAAVGIKIDVGDETQNKYIDGVHRMGQFFVNRTLNPLIHSDILFDISPDGRKQKKVLNILHPFTKKVIQTREANFNDIEVINFENVVEEDNFKIQKKRLAMLDLLIFAKRHHEEIDDKGIREEVDTFGHDTTTTAATMSLMLLANHKDVQERIITELDEIFGDSKRSATYDDLQKMKYLDRCLKECLRLYPSVPMIMRVLHEDVQLTHHKAPAESEIIIHIFDIHRDPTHFPDPERFDPDRFLPENCKGRHPYAYIPFSAGPRNCIGQRFALLELKSIVSSVLRNFTMEPVDKPENIKFQTDLVLRTTGPINIKFIRREQCC